MTEQEKIHTAAGRVGLDNPIEHKNSYKCG